MPKLLMISTIPATLRTFFIPFARYFRARGWQVDGMASSISTCSECVEAFDRVWDIEWSRNPLDFKNLFVVPAKLREIVSTHQYDVVHVFTPIAAFVTRFALSSLKKTAKPKVIYTALGFRFYRGEKLLKNAIFLSLEKLAGNWTDYLIVINKEDEDAAKRYGIVSSEKIGHIPSGIGVNLDKYDANAVSEADVTRVQQELGITEENPLLLSIAEFIPRKHPQDILQAFAKLSRSNVRLAFAGEGKMLEDMKQLANRLGISDRVDFLGYRRDIPALIKAARTTILASELEGLPISIIESLCMETPVIGSEIRGNTDLLEEGCGLLFKVGDTNALAQAMANILDNSQEAKIMGAKGKQKMKIYELNSVLKQHEDLYNRVMERNNE